VRSCSWPRGPSATSWAGSCPSSGWGAGRRRRPGSPAPAPERS